MDSKIISLASPVKYRTEESEEQMAQRKLYTQEFKIESVPPAPARVPGQGAGQHLPNGKDLGISDNTLQSWKLQMERTPGKAFPEKGNP
mgnify:CR=1 FL=1